MSNPEPSLSEQQQIRLEKLDQLRELGVNPFPTKFDVTYLSAEIHSDESLQTESQEDAPSSGTATINRNQAPETGSSPATS